MLNKTLAMREHDSVSPAVQPKQCTMVLSLSAIIQMLLSGSFISSLRVSNFCDDNVPIGNLAPSH